MIYTCYEMIQDCRANQPQGWRYFIAQYVPAVRKLLAHYFPERAADTHLIDRVLKTLVQSDSILFHSTDAAPERSFAADLRQQVLRAVESDRASAPAEIGLELETLSEALAPLTMIETQAVWMETMRYDSVATGRILHIDPKTVEKNRERAADLVRGKVDSWRRNLLQENGLELGRAAAAVHTEDCPPSKTFFDAMDGRITWRNREVMEGHLAGCLHCVDHFCRLLEAADLQRDQKPLAVEEAATLERQLGIQAPKAGIWARVFARKSAKLC